MVQERHRGGDDEADDHESLRRLASRLVGAMRRARREGAPPVGHRFGSGRRVLTVVEKSGLPSAIEHPVAGPAARFRIAIGPAHPRRAWGNAARRAA